MKEFIDKLIGRLEEKFKYNSEQAEIYIDDSDKDAYFREKKDLYMDRANIYGEVIRIINQLAEEYNNGWISVLERLPETNESVLCWAKSTARGGDVCFVGSCHNGFWFLQSSADTHSFPGQYVIVAWQPLPESYQEEGGKNE